MTDQEHFDNKKGDCPCLYTDEYYYSGIVRKYYTKCLATGKNCELDNCPIYYWVAFVRR